MLLFDTPHRIAITAAVASRADVLYVEVQVVRPLAVIWVRRTAPIVAAVAHTAEPTAVVAVTSKREKQTLGKDRWLFPKYRPRA